MNVDMRYDGHKVTWRGHGEFNATSGLPGYQVRHNQCLREQGPIPEGVYTIDVRDDLRRARDDGTHQCQLKWSPVIQSIPRGDAAGVCEPVWANWGRNRVALNPLDDRTKKACAPQRGGFFLHDSAKGYTHGCIEIEARFFEGLKSYREGMQRMLSPMREILFLQVMYFFETTNGGTRIP